MENKVAFKKGENLVTITFNSKDYFGLSSTIYNLAVYDKEGLAYNIRDFIESDLNNYKEELQDCSINELIDSRVDDIMYGYDDYCGIETLYSEAKDDSLVQVEFVAGGQVYNELLKMFPDSEPIKELASLWKKYQLKGGVNQSVINQINELLDKLDSGKNEDDLAEEIVTDYIKQNY